jgi:hypothetical protein
MRISAHKSDNQKTGQLPVWGIKNQITAWHGNYTVILKRLENSGTKSRPSREFSQFFMDA